MPRLRSCILTHYKLNLNRHSTIIMKCSVQRPISSFGSSVSLRSLFTSNRSTNNIQQTKPSSKCIRVFRMNQFHERHAIYLAFVRWKRSNELGSVIQSTKLPRLYNYFMLFFGCRLLLFFQWQSNVEIVCLWNMKNGKRQIMNEEKKQCNQAHAPHAVP